MATIFDVAREAGVSIKTVSRVLNEEANVRPATRDKVREAMGRLDYRPSGAARELRSGKPRSIGMLFIDPSSGFQARLHHAALQACNDAGYFLSAGLFSENPAQWADELSDFIARTRVERMILLPPLCGSPEMVDLLRERGVSFVLVSPPRSMPESPSVCMDDRRAAREITEHLIGLGHRRIGHIAGPEDHIAGGLRREGFKDALQAAGLPVEADWIQPGEFRFREAQLSAERMLADPERRPTAVFAANDEMAAAVCFTANSLGLRVPEDLSVAGFDDVAIARTLWPPLTTIAQPFNAMADEAVRLLVQSSGTIKAEALVLGYEMKIRRSTAPPKA